MPRNRGYKRLDNLSLGYGGTKTEMERLLKDAQALSGVEYNIDNLDDVYNAINVIQTEMGVTGTTALESAETFSGAMASMKASLSNVMGNLAIGEDVKPALEALAKTTSTFLFNNLLPMLGNILSALPGAIVTFVQATIPYVVEAGSNLMKSLGDAIMSVIPDALKPFAKQFGKLGKVAEKGLGAVTGAFNDVWSTVSDFLGGIDWSAVISGLKTALDSTIQFIQPWVNYIKGYIDIILDYFTGLWDGIKQGLNGDWAGAFDTLKQTFITAIIGMAENILTAFSGMWDNVKSLMTSIDWGATATTLVTMLGTAISGAMSFLGDLGMAIKDWIFTSLGATTWGDVGISIGTALWSAIISALELLTTIGESIKNWIFNALSVSDWTSVGTAIGNLIISAITALVDFGTTVATALWGFITTGFSTTSADSGNSVGQTVVDAIIAGITALSEVIAGIATSIWNWISTAWATIDWSSLGSDIVAGIKAGISNAWGTFTSWVSGKAAELKDFFANPLGIESPSTVMRDEIGQWIPAGIGEGIAKGMHFVTSAIRSVTDSIKNTQLPMPKISAMADYNTKDYGSLLKSPTFRSNSFNLATSTNNDVDLSRTNELLEMLYQKEGNLVADDGAILGRYGPMLDRENGIVARNKQVRRLF